MSAKTLIGVLLVAVGAALLVTVGWGADFGHVGPGRMEAWAWASGLTGLGVLVLPITRP